jgi:hypothetical protein
VDGLIGGAVDFDGGIILDNPAYFKSFLASN